MSEGLEEFRYLEEFLAMVDDARMGLGDYAEALRESAGGQQEYTNEMMRNIKWLSNEQSRLETRFAPSQYIPPPLPSPLGQQPAIGRMVGGQWVLPGMERMVGAGGVAQWKQLGLPFTGEMTTGAAMRGDLGSQADAMRSVMRTAVLDRESRERISQMTPAEGGGLRGIVGRWQADQRALADQPSGDVRRQTVYALWYNRVLQQQLQIIGNLGGQLQKTSQSWKEHNRQVEGSQRVMDDMTESLGIANVALEEQTTHVVTIAAARFGGTFLEVGAGAANAAIGLNSMLMVIKSLAPVLGTTAVALGSVVIGIGAVVATGIIMAEGMTEHTARMEKLEEQALRSSVTWTGYQTALRDASYNIVIFRSAADGATLSQEELNWQAEHGTMIVGRSAEAFAEAQLALEGYASAMRMTANAIETTVDVAFAMAPQAAMAFGEIRRAEEHYQADMRTLTERHQDLLTMAQEQGMTDRLERQINQNEEAQARLQAQQENAREGALRAMGGIVLDFLSVAAEAGAFETLVDYQNAVFQTMQEFDMATAGEILMGKAFMGTLALGPEIGMGTAISGAAGIAADAINITAGTVTLTGPVYLPMIMKPYGGEENINNEIGNELRLQGVHTGR